MATAAEWYKIRAETFGKSQLSRSRFNSLPLAVLQKLSNRAHDIILLLVSQFRIDW